MNTASKSALVVESPLYLSSCCACFLSVSTVTMDPVPFSISDSAHVCGHWMPSLLIAAANGCVLYLK